MLRVVFVGKGGVSAASSNYLSLNWKLARARKLQKFEKDKAVDVARFRNNERGKLFIILAPQKNRKICSAAYGFGLLHLQLH